MSKQILKSMEDIIALIEKHEVKFVDLRFTDPRGKEQHLTLPASKVDAELFEHGKMFDGSSIRGWKSIDDSDMVLLPAAETAVMDPFCQEATLNLRCNIVEPNTLVPYSRDPRQIALRAEAYMKSTGIADACYVGPEPEFNVFDDVRFKVDMSGAGYSLDSEEAAWNSGATFEHGNLGHRPKVKGGYFPVPPVDSSQDLRSTMSLVMEEMGLVVEAHHHEVATGNQNEIATRFNSLTYKADEMQIFKYVVHNVAHSLGKTATFMPKPIVGDNGNGMHCHLSLAKNGTNLFSGDQYAGLSDTALYFIGGIIKHAKALNVFTNPCTNSYKRLVPGFEAPVMLAYSARNRSAAIRVPHVIDAPARRIEVRFPDPAANPYLAFSALLMAGLDGIENRIHPGDPMDKDLYDLPPEELKDIVTVCDTLAQACDSVEQDCEFLLKGDVFSRDFIDSYVAQLREDVLRLRMTTHPVEFEMYYSV